MSSCARRTAALSAACDASLRRGISGIASLDFHRPYGCSKGAADQYVLDYARTFGLPAAVFRMSCIYGPAPVRHRGSGLGGALPAFARSRASRSTSTATACRCATCCSSKIWSTRCCSRRRTYQHALRAGVQHRRRPRQHHQPARTAGADRRAARRDARGPTSRTGGRAINATTSRDTRKFTRGHRLGAARQRARTASSGSTNGCCRMPAGLAAPQLMAASGGVMRFALINPPWTLRRQHLLRLPRAAPAAGVRLLQGAARSARATRSMLVDAQLEGLDTRRGRASASPRSQPDFTVVTTAPSYLFWRCAPPELRVPQETVRRRSRRRRNVVVVGPHASTTPRATLAQTRRRRRGAWANAKRSCRDWPATGRQCHRSAYRGRRRSTCKASRTPRHGRAARARIGRARLIARHRHHHHRFDAPPDGPGAEMETSRGCPYHCTFCAKDNFRNKFRRRPLARDRSRNWMA